MKKIFLGLSVFVGLLFSCEENEEVTEAEEIVAPEATADEFETLKGEPLIIDFLENDTLVDGYTLYYIDESSAEGGEIVINDDGTFTYTSAEDFFGEDSFTYTICLEDNISEDGCTTGEVVISVIEVYTLTDDDYAYIANEFRGVEGYENQIANLATFGNFNRVVDNDAYWSNDMLQEALNVLIEENYGDDAVEGQTFQITYEIYDGSVTTETVQIDYEQVELEKVAIQYTLTEEDYSLIAEELSLIYPDAAENLATFGNFNTEDWSSEMIETAIQIALSENTDAEEGDLYEVTYAYYDGTTSDTASITLEHALPVIELPVIGTAYELVEADYDLIVSNLSSVYPDATSSMATYSNFERRDGNAAYWSDEMVQEALLIVIEENFSDAVEGDIFTVTYAFYDGSAGSEAVYVEYSNSDDDAISYTLIDTDYDLIVSNLSSLYPDATSSMATYSNFDRGFDEDAEWSDEMVQEALLIVIEENFPDAVAGDIFSVTYAFYDGSAGSETVEFEL